MVRGDPQLRQRPAAAGLIAQRPRRRQRPGAGDRPAIAALAGRRSRRPRRSTSGPSAATASTARGSERARFDQQPIEANATVSACLEAYRATQDAAWLNEARSAFEWFLGRNDLGQELYDPGHRRLLRRPPGRPDQPEPGGRIDARLPALARRDEPAGKLPGGIPPGTVVVPRAHGPDCDPQVGSPPTWTSSAPGSSSSRPTPASSSGRSRSPNESRIEQIIARVTALSEGEVERQLDGGDAGVPRAPPADPRVLPAPLRTGPQAPADRPAGQREPAAADRLVLHPGVRARIGGPVQPVDGLAPRPVGPARRVAAGSS